MPMQNLRILRLWLYLVAALIALMVLVGGATRLTESGLSITEWKPLSGTLPPLSAQQWQNEFDKYQTTTQYLELNRGMSLEDFKTIYWWEWMHRFLGRMIGLAFALPFLFFALTKNLPRPLLLKLGGILLLGGLQGAVGWWMVASGLADRINVVPYRLAIHLTLALIIFACILRVAFSLTHPARATSRHLSLDPRRHNSDVSELCFDNTHIGMPMWDGNDVNKFWFNCTILTFIFLQIFLGGLVAGNRAGYIYNTWPLMDGDIVPSGLFIMEPWWRNFFENTALVQFMHRCTAYVLLILGLAIFLKERSKGEGILFAALLLQASLGIATLLSGMNFALALMHQAGIILVLSIVIYHQKHFSFRHLPAGQD